MTTKKTRKPRAAETYRRTLKGEPYTYTPNNDGYGVVAAGSPTDRLHRSYQVTVDPLTGTATRCTCADHVERKHPCKHMQGAESLDRSLRRRRALDLVTEAGRLAAAAARKDQTLVYVWEALRECYTRLRAAATVPEAASALGTGRRCVWGFPALRRCLDAALVWVR